MDGAKSKGRGLSHCHGLVVSPLNSMAAQLQHSFAAWRAQSASIQWTVLGDGPLEIFGGGAEGEEHWRDWIAWSKALGSVALIGTQVNVRPQMGHTKPV